MVADFIRGWSANQCLRETKNSDGQSAHYDPDTLGRLMRQTLPDGQKWELNYHIADQC